MTAPTLVPVTWCDRCGQGFRYLAALREHMKKIHCRNSGRLHCRNSGRLDVSRQLFAALLAIAEQVTDPTRQQRRAIDLARTMLTEQS